MGMKEFVRERWLGYGIIHSYIRCNESVPCRGKRVFWNRYRKLEMGEFQNKHHDYFHYETFLQFCMYLVSYHAAIFLTFLECRSTSPRFLIFLLVLWKLKYFAIFSPSPTSAQVTCMVLVIMEASSGIPSIRAHQWIVMASAEITPSPEINTALTLMLILPSQIQAAPLFSRQLLIKWLCSYRAVFIYFTWRKNWWIFVVVTCAHFDCVLSTLLECD